MPEKASGYKPLDILPGNNSLFRAASLPIYPDERFWPILKIGSLANAVVESRLLCESGIYYAPYRPGGE